MDPPSGVDLLTLDAFPDDLAQDLVAQLSRRVSVPCRLLDGHEPSELPWIQGRDQADADKLLAQLEERAGADGTVLVGMTQVDLGNPIFTFFFGRARQHGRAALVSLARLAPGFYGLPDDRALTIRRATLEIVHELGHVIGLPHCRDFACVMHFAATVESIDTRGSGLCGRCAENAPAVLLEIT
jgi:archaemetzincin